MWSFNVERKLIRNGDSGSARPGEEMYAGESVTTVIAEQELTEDLALSLLKRPELEREALEKISKNINLMKSRKVKLALISHPKTPRHVLLPLLRHLFTFDLMRVALMATIAADVKVAAEESLINRLEKLSLGEKLSLARRASGRVAGALLRDSEPRVIDAALQNGRVTETAVIKELSRQSASPQLINALCNDPKWKLRTDIVIALVRNENTPIAVAIDLATSLPAAVVQRILKESDLSGQKGTLLRNAIAPSVKPAE